MKKFCILLCLLVCLTALTGCSEISAQVETIAQQVDVESMVTGLIAKIDWDELKRYAEEGYTSLTEKYPALKSENIKSYLKESGLDLLKKYIESTDESLQKNADKLGQIIMILEPELSDEVNSVLEK